MSELAAEGSRRKMMDLGGDLRGVDAHRAFRSPDARRAFVRAALEELNVSEQCATGAGGHLIPKFADGPHNGFYAWELGFSWRNSEPDILQTMQRHGSVLLHRHCDACFSDARHRELEQPRLKLSGRFVDWAPGSKTLEQLGVMALGGFLRSFRARARRLEREERAVRSLVRACATAIRRARKAERSSAYEQRKQRAAEARAKMQARRRDETKGIERVARRIGAAISTRR